MWWRIVIAGVLILHGLGHSMGFLAGWTDIPSGLADGHSFMSNEMVMNSAIGRAFGLFWVAALLLSVVAGLALLMNQAWWSSIAIASAVVSLLAIGPWLNLMAPWSAIGAVVVDLLVLALLLLPWGEQILGHIR